jgi:hypothetical protein
MFGPGLALGASDGGNPNAALKAEIDALRRELSELRAQVKGQQEQGATKQDVATLKQAVTDVREASIRPPYEWDKSTSFHFGGYGAVGYSSQKTGGRGFDRAVFVPGFHFNYRDIAFAEAKIETAIAPNGETETKLESANLNLFLGDYAVLTAGKFLSPLGQFQQNYHAPWINKLASRPVGFGEEATGAPLANVGAQIRGGFPVGAFKANYALFVVNAPRLVADGGDIELLTNDSGTSAPNNKKIWGGRASFFPMPALEIGVSGATGKTAVQLDGGAVGLSRTYRASGVDFAWQVGKQWDFRGEYIRQSVGSAVGDEIEGTPIDNDGQTWKARYLQAAYKFTPKWEGVTRYSKFDSVEGSQWQKQWALGLNYWYASNVVGKVSYEFNKGRLNRDTDDNRLLLQLTYGF